METTPDHPVTAATLGIGFQDIAEYMAKLQLDKDDDGTYFLREEGMAYIQASSRKKPEVIEKYKDCFYEAYCMWSLENFMTDEMSISQDVLDFVNEYQDAEKEDLASAKPP